ncbi:hypothetical protein GCM10020331_021120 [Ectobacillus funiculus]
MLKKTFRCTRYSKCIEVYEEGKWIFLEGDKYIVTWALGHLVTLADPDVYDMKYRTWNLEDLPMLPERMKLVVIKTNRKNSLML